MSDRLKFGAFFAPFHPVGQNPTLSFEYDLDRAVALDKFGFDECWFGEHHSGGYETIGSPELMIVAAAERTKHIKLGTGVLSLPYHNPFILADRLVQLDHMTRGRFIFGAGPGALPTDAYMMGIDPVDQRRRMEESLDVIIRLFKGETVSVETDWFTLKDATLHVRPYTHPHPEIAVAAMVTPSGPRLAGQLGVGLLSLSMQVADGFAAIGKAWGVVGEQAEKAGRPAPDRKDWRVLGTMHLAATREQAIEDCTYGLEDFANYFGGGAGFVPLAEHVGDEERTPRQYVEAYAESDSVVIGTPADAIEYIQGLLDQSGGFGTFLLLGHDWASPEATIESFRLFAREVIPHFTGQIDPPRVSHDWATAKRGELFGRAGQAMLNAIVSHVEEQDADKAAAAAGSDAAAAAGSDAAAAAGSDVAAAAASNGGGN